MLRLLLVLTLFFSASFPTLGAEAQAESAIEKLEIWIWPEFDRQAVLVLYKIQLSANTPLPGQISVPIPVEVGEPHAVAWQDSNGDLLVAEYSRVLSGEQALITFQSETREAQIEYYQDLQFAGASKTFTFAWGGGVEIGDVSYEVQVPASASDVQVSPAPGESTTGTYNLTYLQGDLGQIGEADTFNIELSYTKSNDTLTVDTLVTPVPLPTSAPVSPEGGTPDVAEIVPYLLGGAGLGLILLGGYLFYRYRLDQEPAPKRTRRRRSKKTEESGLEIDASPVFCHNCGTKASSSDRFCRHCGTQLRR